MAALLTLVDTDDEERRIVAQPVGQFSVDRVGDFLRRRAPVSA